MDEAERYHRASSALASQFPVLVLFPATHTALGPLLSPSIVPYGVWV